MDLLMNMYICFLTAKDAKLPKDTTELYGNKIFNREVLKGCVKEAKDFCYTNIKVL